MKVGQPMSHTYLLLWLTTALVPFEMRSPPKSSTTTLGHLKLSRPPLELHSPISLSLAFNHGIQVDQEANGRPLVRQESMPSLL